MTSPRNQVISLYVSPQRQEEEECFLPLLGENFPSRLSFTSHWPELCHVPMPDPVTDKGGRWNFQCSCRQTKICSLGQGHSFLWSTWLGFCWQRRTVSAGRNHDELFSGLKALWVFYLLLLLHQVNLHSPSKANSYVPSPWGVPLHLQSNALLPQNAQSLCISHITLFTVCFVLTNAPESLLIMIPWEEGPHLVHVCGTLTAFSQKLIPIRQICHEARDHTFLIHQCIPST